MAHIILADDEEGLLTLFKRYIAHLSPAATVSTVTNGQKALELFEQSGADLIISNHNMPLMNGLELVRILRARGVTIPIVVTSGNPSLSAEAYEAEASLFVWTTHFIKELPAILLLIED